MDQVTKGVQSATSKETNLTFGSCIFPCYDGGQRCGVNEERIGQSLKAGDDGQDERKLVEETNGVDCDWWRRVWRLENGDAPELPALNPQFFGG